MNNVEVCTIIDDSNEIMEKEFEKLFKDVKGDTMLNLVLSNLTDYVDLGVRTFKKQKLSDILMSMDRDEAFFTIENIFEARDFLEDFDITDIVGYLTDVYSTRDVLDELDEDDIASWCESNDFGEKILGEMSKDDIRDYVRNNYDPDDFVEMEWRSW